MKKTPTTTKKTSLTPVNVAKIAQLASLPVTSQEAVDLSNQLGVTVTYVSQLHKLSTESVSETSQVTGLENIYREDEIDNTRMLSQEQALSNAKQTYNGFFVVKSVFEE